MTEDRSGYTPFDDVMSCRVRSDRKCCGARGACRVDISPRWRRRRRQTATTTSRNVSSAERGERRRYSTNSSSPRLALSITRYTNLSSSKSDGCKKRFLTFFKIFFVTFLNVFLNFPNVFYFLKKSWQSSERRADNKKHFQK